MGMSSVLNFTLLHHTVSKMTERTTSMPAALRRRREYAGPTLFSYGFRPFFLGGALWAALGILLWLPQYFGELSLPTASHRSTGISMRCSSDPPAIATGFLLTAIPNWTGRLPVNGYPLAGLGVLWLAGRVAVAGSAIWGAEELAAVIDVAFLATLTAVALREIVAGKNWRNLRVSNIVFHLEAIERGNADYGIRLGIAAAIGLIMLVGGRIVPSFTHNWLVRNNPGRLPRQFARFDALVLGTSALALARGSCCRR